jgi:hypothetical protein
MIDYIQKSELSNDYYLINYINRFNLFKETNFLDKTKNENDTINQFYKGHLQDIFKYSIININHKLYNRIYESNLYIKSINDQITQIYSIENNMKNNDFEIHNDYEIKLDKTDCITFGNKFKEFYKSNYKIDLNVELKKSYDNPTTPYYINCEYKWNVKK